MGMRTSVVGLLALALASIAWEPPVRAAASFVIGPRRALLSACMHAEPAFEGKHVRSHVLGDVRT